MLDTEHSLILSPKFVDVVFYPARQEVKGIELVVPAGTSICHRGRFDSFLLRHDIDCGDAARGSERSC